MKIISLFVAVIAFALVATNANAQGPTYPRVESARAGAVVPPVDEDDEPFDSSTPIGEIKSVLSALKALNQVVEEQNKKIESMSVVLNGQTCQTDRSDEILDALQTSSRQQLDSTQTLIKKIDDALNDKSLSTEISALLEALKNESELSDKSLSTEISSSLETLKAELTSTQTSTNQAVSDTLTKTIQEIGTALAATEENVKNAIPPPEVEKPFGTFWAGLKTSASTTIIGFVVWQIVLFLWKKRKEIKAEKEKKEQEEREELQRLRALQGQLNQQVAQSPSMQNQTPQTNEFKLY